MVKKSVPITTLLIILLANTVMAEPLNFEYDSAIIYGSSFYPSDFVPEINVYARDVKSGKTYQVTVPTETYEYQLKLPAPATYIFFSWTNIEDETQQMGAVLSKCDGSSQDICEGFDKHFPTPIQLEPYQIISDLEVANYYYPIEFTHLFVPKP